MDKTNFIAFRNICIPHFTLQCLSRQQKRINGQTSQLPRHTLLQSFYF